jgi:hypothetical protein
MYDDTPITRRSALVLGGLGLGGTALSTGAMAKSQDDGDDENGNGDGNGNDGNGDRMRQYRVTVANNTPGQPFTPPAVAAHRSSVEVFSVGDEANEPTRQVAENGNLGPLAELIEDTNAIARSTANSAIQSRVTISTNGCHQRWAPIDRPLAIVTQNSVSDRSSALQRDAIYSVAVSVAVAS